MSKMILAAYSHSLRELFFGSWREEYDYYQKIDVPIGEFFRQSTVNPISEMDRRITSSITARRKVNKKPLL